MACKVLFSRTWDRKRDWPFWDWYIADLEDDAKLFAYKEFQY